MTDNQKKLMVKAKALYHITDLGISIRRGEVLNLSEAEANKSNDLWRGKEFGLLDVKWVFGGHEVPVPKNKTVVASREQIGQGLPNQAHLAVHPSQQPATQEDVISLRKEITALRSDLASMVSKSQQAMAELNSEIAKLELRLAEAEETKVKRVGRPPKSAQTDDSE